MPSHSRLSLQRLHSWTRLPLLPQQVAHVHGKVHVIRLAERLQHVSPLRIRNEFAPQRFLAMHAPLEVLRVADNKQRPLCTCERNVHALLLRQKTEAVCAHA